MSARSTVIVPTLADSSRADSLRRALDSLWTSTTDPASLRIHVVVNGQRHDPAVLEWLKAQPVTLTQLQLGSAPLARLEGRRLVETDYFGYLDDDDEYLPGSLDERVLALESDRDSDLLVCNGWELRQSRDQLLFHQLTQLRVDPLRALLRENWLASGGSLFRTATVGVTYFEDPMPYFEWTWLAWRLAIDGRRIRVSETPGFRIHDTPGSASKSSEYAAANIELFERMLADEPPSDVARIVSGRLQAQWAQRSASRLASGDVASARAAWRNVQRYPGAWRYTGLILRHTASQLVSKFTSAFGMH